MTQPQNPSLTPLQAQIQGNPLGADLIQIVEFGGQVIYRLNNFQAVWYVGSGDPHFIPGQLINNLYLDNITGHIWQFDGFTWHLLPSGGGGGGSGAIGVSFTTTANPSDTIPVPGVLSSSYAVLSATNSIAAAMIAAGQVEIAVSTDSVTVTHPSTAGGSFNIVTSASTGGTGLGVTELNGLTGNLNLTPGSGIGVASSGTSIVVTNEGVTSLNSLAGALALVAGSNVTITPSGNTLIIASTGGGGVTSLNTLTGAVVFAPGTNVSFSTTGNTVTVNASGTTTPVPWLDIQNYGSLPKPSSVANLVGTATTVSGSPNVTLGSSAFSSALPNGQGVCIFAAGAATAQNTPVAPTVTSPNMAGSQTIRYQCVGYDVNGGLTAASSTGVVTTAPNVFGPPPVVISSISASGGTVTVNFSSALNTTVSAGMTIHITGVTGAGASWNGIFTVVSAPTNSQITYALVGASGTGTVNTSSLGRLSNTAIITSIARNASGLVTMTLSQAPQWTTQTGLNPTVVTVENVFPLNMQGTFVISTVSGNVVTYQTGILQTTSGIPTSSVAMTATVWEFTTVACPALATITATSTAGYYIYSDSANPGGALTLIGKTIVGDCHFTDWGPCIGSGYSAPSYVPHTPPSVTQNEMFTSKVVSGGGTTSIVLANNVPTSIGSLGATIVFDDGPNLLTAIAAAATGISGSVLISPPRTSITTPEYIFNSRVNLTAGINVIFGNPCVVNDTLHNPGDMQMLAMFGSPNTVSPTFSQQNYVPISGIGNPMLQISNLSGAGNGATIVDGLAFICSSNNGQNAVLGVNNPSIAQMRNCYFTSNIVLGGDTNVGLILEDADSFTLDTVTFAFFSRFYASNFPPVGQSNISGPLPALWLRASDNPNLGNDGQSCDIFNMYGANQWSGRGILVDQKYATFTSPSPSNRTFQFGDMIWNQAAITPMIMFWGNQYRDITVARVTMDTTPMAVIANWTTSNLENVEMLDCSTDPTNTLTTGNGITGLIINGVVGVTQNNAGTIQRLNDSISSFTANGNSAAATYHAQPLILGAGGIVAFPIIQPGAQIAADTFQRANENPLSDSGNWTTFTTQPQLLSDIVVPSVTGTYCESIWTGLTWPADQFSEIVIGNWVNDANNFAVAIVRASGTSSYRLIAQAGNNLMIVQRIVSGVATTIITSTVISVAGDRLRLQVQGSVISLLRNGVLNASVQDTALTSGSAGFGTRANVAVTASPIASWNGGIPTPIYATVVSGGSLAVQAWPVQVGFVGFDGGVTAPTPSITVTTTSGNQSILVQWGVISGVTGANVYLNGALQNSSPLSGTSTTITSYTPQSLIPSTDGTGLPCIYPNVVLTPEIIVPSGTNEVTLAAGTLTANRTQFLPDSTGIVALSWTSANVTPITANLSTTTDQLLMSATVPANTLNSLLRTLRIRVSGVYSLPVSTSPTSLTFKIKLGTLTLIDIVTTAASDSTGVTNNKWILECDATTQTAGASAAFEASATATVDLGALDISANTVFMDINTATIGTLDSTANQTLQITVAFSTATTSNSCTQRQMVLNTVN